MLAGSSDFLKNLEMNFYEKAPSFLSILATNSTFTRLMSQMKDVFGEGW